ncbi:MAG TPA: hypothetical protein VGB88_01315 [Alphaproteobacteria bacterium]
MTATEIKDSSRRTEALQSQLASVLFQFYNGELADDDEYRRVVNALCKALLDLDTARKN